MKQAVMYGAGSIGRGFIAQLFSESGYEVVFVDTDSALIDLLNERQSYPLRFVSDSDSHETTVGPVRGIYSQDSKTVAAAIATADLVATSVGKNALALIAPNIAAGLRLRWQGQNRTPLNIFVCENMLQAGEYLKDLIKDCLPKDLHDIFSQTTGMVETCIRRNVPVMTPALQDGDPLRVIAEEYSELPVDERTFRGELPRIRNMHAHSPFDFFIQQKLFAYNMAHATAAYLGYLQDFALLAEAVRKPDIKYIVKSALIESSFALSRQSNRPLGELIDFSEDLLFRFGNRSLGISVPRVAADPVRKVSVNDRLVGAANLCLKHGRFPAYIATGIAAAYSYVNPHDVSVPALQSYVQKNGIHAALKHYSQIDSTHPLNPCIIEIYQMFQNRKSTESIIDRAQEWTILHRRTT